MKGVRIERERWGGENMQCKQKEVTPKNHVNPQLTKVVKRLSKWFKFSAII